MNSTIAALPHLLEIMNGADGISDIEGKAAMGSGESIGKRMSFKTAVLFGAVALWCVPSR
jgi:hypothetical protein